MLRMTRKPLIVIVAVGLSVTAVVGYALWPKTVRPACSSFKDSQSCFEAGSCVWRSDKIDCGFSPADTCHYGCYGK